MIETMNGSELDGFASSYGILRRPCETDESLRQKVVHAMSRPKPARVEKWQRWRWEDRPEFIVGLVEQDHNVSTVDHCHVVSAYANDMLVHVGWHFLGYTKPDKIEVGQRWRTPGVERPREVAAIMDGGLTLRFADGGALPCGTLLEYSMFEYLGMAPPVEKASTPANMQYPADPHPLRATSPDARSNLREANLDRGWPKVALVWRDVRGRGVARGRMVYDGGMADDVRGCSSEREVSRHGSGDECEHDQDSKAKSGEHRADSDERRGASEGALSRSVREPQGSHVGTRRGRCAVCAGAAHA